MKIAIHPYRYTKYMFLLLLALIIGGNIMGCAAVVIGAVAAGAGTTAAVATDPRTSGTILDDNANETKLRLQYAKYANSNIYVQSYNGAVLLTGQVPNMAIRESAEFNAKVLPGVHKIYDYLTMSITQSITAITTDSYTTAQVRGHILKLPAIHSSSIKVVTTDNVVYLMGIVTPMQAKEVSRVASSVGGVNKVITLFQYVTSK